MTQKNNLFQQKPKPPADQNKFRSLAKRPSNLPTKQLPALRPFPSSPKQQTHSRRPRPTPTPADLLAISLRETKGPLTSTSR